jgi:hypothetical protein
MKAKINSLETDLIIEKTPINSMLLLEFIELKHKEIIRLHNVCKRKDIAIQKAIDELKRVSTDRLNDGNFNIDLIEELENTIG